MSSNRGPRDPADAPTASENFIDPSFSANNYSDLLWMPHNQHKISRINDDDYRDIGVDVRHTRIGIAYHHLCKPFLLRLGLYQVSQMKNIIIDRSLLAGLVERWRPETHSFHLPVGEMTVTLQDVSCLWALPITGSPVTGRSDGNWYTLADELLGAGTASAVFKKKKRSGPNDLQEVRMISGYAISLKLLHNRFAAMPNEPTPEQVRQYTRAYVLDLFGSMFFADSSGDSVPAMYLQFLQNIDAPNQYNWGGAVLACLYRSLCVAVQRKTKSMSGPTVLLQHWCWSRLPTGRPRSLHSWTPDWRKPDEHSCPAFGEKWCCLHDYHVGHNRSGVSYFRNELQKLEDYMVIWEPYREMLLENPNALSLRVNQESGIWLARVPLVHFWMIEHHYPDRVMRQFGYSQVIPPPLPLAEDEIRRLHKIIHSAVSGRESWSVMHQTYVDQASNPADHLVVPTGYWSSIEILPYRHWFQNDCMFNIFLGKRCIEGLDNPIPEYRDEIGEVGYIPSAPKSTRDALRGMKIVGAAIQLVKTRTYKKIGKFFLKASCGLLRDNGMDAKLGSIFREANLPENIDDISDGDVPADQEPIPEFHQDQNPNYHQRWFETNEGFNDCFAFGPSHLNLGADDQGTAMQGDTGPSHVYEDPSLQLFSEMLGIPMNNQASAQDITGPSQVYQASNNFVNWDETFATPTMPAFESQTYNEVPAQEVQYMSHTGPSQVYQGSDEPYVTGAQEDVGHSPVVTPRTQAVDNLFGPSYNNVYVRRKRTDKQPERQRRYPERERRHPDKFTFN